MRKCARDDDGLATVRGPHADSDMARRAARYAKDAGAGNGNARSEGKDRRTASDRSDQRDASDDHGLCACWEKYRCRSRRDSGRWIPDLAIDLEGTEVCDWLTSRGITCVLLKYRVPSVPYDWQCDCRPHNLALSVPSLQDTQRAMRLVRFHAAQWHIDPHKLGVLGFSAGGYLVAEISTNFERRLYPPVDAADNESSRPDFALPIYPGHLVTPDGRLNPNVPVTSKTPPTFLVQAEDDYVDGVKQSLVYYTALAKANVPVEMHLYAHGGHAFGLRHTKWPITDWPRLAEAWLRTIGIVQD